MKDHKFIAVVYEWWKNGYPYKADESELFATLRDAEAYSAQHPGGSYGPVKVWTRDDD